MQETQLILPVTVIMLPIVRPDNVLLSVECHEVSC